jgi:archaellum component FlaF (FlaF/FlaG flagellin family)
MERNGMYAAIGAAVLIAVLLVALALSFMSLSSANQQLQQYKEQQRQVSLAITALHMQDMQAARAWWISANQDTYREFQQQGIVVEADYIDTPYYTAVLYPADPYATTLGPKGNAGPGEVIVGLGSYYSDNMTQLGWLANYRVNTTTHQVAGFTAALASRIAYDNYEKMLAKDIYQNLGVSGDAIQVAIPVTLDTSYLPDRGEWLDVTEYRYNFRNTDKPAYLTVKTYVNASTGEETGVDISQPYYTTVSPVIH